jgi:putative SOS response-associated peptidase YedK
LGEIIQRFNLNQEEDTVEHSPRYNIAPTQTVPVIVEDGGEKKAVPMRWGLVPRWAKDLKIGNRLINARSETIRQKPAFRRSFLRHRCLVPADGFYEWNVTEEKKQPMRIVLDQGELFAFAGLWDQWESPEGDVVHSFTIITTRANEKMADIHDRMPAILHPADESVWLDPSVKDPELLRNMLQPYPSEPMEIYPVSSQVNSPHNDDPDCIQPLSVPTE